MPYPFEFLHENIWPTDTRMAFVLYPFTQEGEQICDEIVRPALDRVPIQFEDAKRAKGVAPLLDEILKGIACSQLVIAILSEENPNVYWELGVAMTWKPRSQILTIGKEEGGKMIPPPFNLGGFRHVPINSTQIEPSRAKLVAEVKATVESHREMLARSVTSARNLLGPIELKFLYRWGNATEGNLVLPAYHAISESPEFSQPLADDVSVFKTEVAQVGPKLLATYMDALALGNLTKAGIAFCNTAVEDETGKRSNQYSFYWTALGNHVLELIGVITEEQRLTRLKRIPNAGLEWRGGHVFMSAIPKY